MSVLGGGHPSFAGGRLADLFSAAGRFLAGAAGGARGPAVTRPRGCYALLGIILGASIVLRVALVLRGGQFFFPDEQRYQVSRWMAQSLLDGNLKLALGAANVDHLGFKVVGMLPALVEALVGENPILPALFFSLFGVVNLALLWRLALAAGADHAEALGAVLLLASSNVLFLYSSHLLPYDVAMTFVLCGFHAGARSQAKPSRSVLAGIWAALAFLTYNGYWMLALLTLLSPAMFCCASGRCWITRTLLPALGFSFSSTFMLLLGALLTGKNFLKGYMRFSKTIDQGSFSEGHVLPLVYLWEAETLLLVLWSILVVCAVFALRSSRPRRTLIWLAALASLYGGLVAFSVVLGKFVVYGRLVRPMVPFIALLAAFGLTTVQRRVGRAWFAPAVVGLVILLAGLNVRHPLRLTYPREFALRVAKLYPDMGAPSAVVASSSYKSPDRVDVGPYAAFYLKYIHPFPKEDTTHVQGEVLLRARHPQSYPPFLYEGFTPEQRSVFRTTSFDMLWVRTRPANRAMGAER